MWAILKYLRTSLLCLLSPAKSVVEQNLCKSELCLGERTKCSLSIVVDLEPGLPVINKKLFKKKRGEIWNVALQVTKDCCSKLSLLSGFESLNFFQKLHLDLNQRELDNGECLFTVLLREH